MNVTEIKKDDLNRTLSVTIQPEDYEQEVEQVLRDYRKKAVLNGFRPGKVPFGLVKKMYGTSVLADQVNKKFSEAVSRHLVDNKLNILGEPLPVEEAEPLDFEHDKEFTLKVDIALAPEFEVNLSKKIKVPYYTIKIDDELLNETVTNYRKQLGALNDADSVETEDYLKGTLTESDPNGSPLENGLTVEDASLTLVAMNDEKQKKSLIGKKAGDQVLLDLKKAFPNDTDLAAMLKIEKEQLESIQSQFLFEIAEIKRFAEAEENQDFYDKLFGKDEVKDHESFITRIKEVIQKNLDQESESRFSKDLIDKLVSVIDPPLPEEFLKRWLKESNKGKYTEEQIDQEFDDFVRGLKWDLIRDRIASDNDIQATEEEILDFAKNYTHAQFHQYGLGHLPEEEIEKFAREQLGKEENRRNFSQSVLERKVIDHVRMVIKIDDKKISRDEFQKLYEKEQNKSSK